MLGNLHNWSNMARIFAVFENPVAVLAAIIRRKAPENVVVRTPTGPVILAMRNFESLKTAFSVFCRGDYPVTGESSHFFVDIGSNVGVAAAFFLSRHRDNRAICCEPDEANLAFLRRTLAQFGDRVTILEKAIGPQAGIGELHRSEDGKYSSLIDAGVTVATQEVEIVAFSDILGRAVAMGASDIVLKIDIEGLEPALVQSVDFADYPAISRIIVESLECSERIERSHARRVRSGYVEDLLFA
ncbi:MAG: FkbM family methyltransferase [Erythrobacter sp.]|jgi:FkbM family methyltransferase|nr:FkbM family methyltransferase [Erythrobacter sp.]